MFKPTAKDINGCIDILRALNCLPRWSAHVQGNYTEVSKLALNCQFASILFEVMAYEQRTNLRFTEYPPIRFDYLPRIALYRAFEKYEKCDILDETYQELFSDHEALENHFLSYMKNIVISMTSTQFFDHISGLESTFEMQIYKAATALATYYEALEIRRFVEEQTFSAIQTRQLDRLEKYKNFPIIRDIFEGVPDDETENETFKIKGLFDKFSSLRNRIRWVKRAPLRNYSVLGHSFDVAVYNYLFSLSEYPHDIKRAETGFFVGIYHDIAEIWTGDMPSPLKDAIPGLRKRTEALEIKVLRTEVFPFLPSWLIPNFEKMMLEMLPKEERDFYKFGDNLAAYIEASTQLMIGSKDYYFAWVVADGVINAEKHSKLAKQVMKKVRKDARVPYILVPVRKLEKRLTRWETLLQQKRELLKLTDIFKFNV